MSAAPRVGLVLGAGGVVGQAFHAGVLAAIEADLGWDPRDAEIVVGTSAGSVTGTLLRFDVPAMDLAAWAVDAPLSAAARPVLDPLAGGATTLPPLRVRRLLGRWWRPPSRALLAATAVRPWTMRPTVLRASMVPPGDVVLTDPAPGLAGLGDAPVPDGLLVCATRVQDGRRVVLGERADAGASLAEAISASCAIPGYFAPVEVGGDWLVDGGVHSPTNADLLVDEPLDLVVIVSPMSAAPGHARGADALHRWSLHRRLHRERRRLEAAGIPVVSFEPRSDSLRAMGLDLMATDRSDRVVRHALLDAGHLMEQGSASRRLAVLGGRADARQGRLETAAAAADRG